MVNCTVCRRAKPRVKAVVSMAFATTVGSQVIQPSSVSQKGERQKGRDKAKRETTKVGMTAKVGQSERDGQMVRVGILQATHGSSKSQQE